MCITALKTYNPCTHAAHRMSKKRVRVSLGKREQKMREGTPANGTVNHWWFKELKEGNLVGLFSTKITMSEVSHKIANWSTLTFSVYIGFARIIQPDEGTKPLLLKSFFRLQTCQTCGKHLITWTSKQNADPWTKKCWHQLQERPANLDKPILNVSILQKTSCISVPTSCCNCGPSAPHSFWFSNHFTCACRWPGGQAAACV